ncbi:hypothetical protein [Aliihoeflea sp. PC F10.4]
MAMAWAIFSTEFNWRRPRSIYSFNAKASVDPQERPRDFIEAAVTAGAAEEVSSPNRDEKKAITGRKRAK